MTKKLMGIVLAGILMFACGRGRAGAEYVPGDIITLGYYEQDNRFYDGAEEIEWYILDIQDRKAFLISKYSLDTLAYHYDYRNFVSWENSNIRSWLDEYFYSSAFSDEEKNVIMETVVKNDMEWIENFPEIASSYEEEMKAGDNSVYDQRDTVDKIYLLSYTEYCKYLYDSEEAERLFYEGKFGFHEHYPYGGATPYLTKDDNLFFDGYWLRTVYWNNGRIAAEAITANVIGFMDNYGIEFIRVDNEGGNFNYLIRPCMWIDLEAYNNLNR